MASIELNGVNHHYAQRDGSHVPALQEINLSIESGDIVALVGESGAGKSTLLRSINLLERPASGRILVDGYGLMGLADDQLRAQRQRIGMIFQHFNLLQTRDVYHNVALPLKLHGFANAEITKRVDKLLDLVGLSQKRYAFPHQLSGGQKQRVAIARALVTEPSVLLCDEATSALDVHTAQSILNLLKEVNQRLGVTIVVVTHQLSVAKQVADQVVVLEAGRIVEHSPVLLFFSDPDSSLGQSLIASHYDRPLPDKIQQAMRSKPKSGDVAAMRLTFCGPLAFEPMVSDFIQAHQVPLNILQGNVEYLHGELLGHLWVTVPADPERMQAFEQFFVDKGVKVDVLGYLAIDA